MRTQSQSAPRRLPTHDLVCHFINEYKHAEADMAAQACMASAAHTALSIYGSDLKPLRGGAARLCTVNPSPNRLSPCAGKLDDGTLVVLHLWLVMTRQPGADGGGGNITMQGYGFFQPIDKIRIYPGGEVRLCRHLICQLSRPEPVLRASRFCMSPIDMRVNAGAHQHQH